MESFSQVPSKLLLFGEHSVLMGFPAITLPLWDFTACLKFPVTETADSANESNFQLKKFFSYLNDHQLWFQSHINLSLLEKALHKGLYLESNIPTGCGLGSSASVCVAIYKAFGISNIDDDDVLMHFYGEMESFFHGKSSGIDPLTIHLERPVIIDKGRVKLIPVDENLLTENIQVYLLDSRIERDASSMIDIFKNELKDENFKNQFQAAYIPVLETIKDKILFDNEKIDWELLKELSNQQFRFFKKLIPEPVYSIWYSHPAVCFKILGAGGGGYFLLFSKRDISNLSGFNVKKIELFYYS